MLIVVAARSFGQGIKQPAVSAMIPRIVPQECLLSFNGIQSSIQSLNMFAAPMAAGGVVMSIWEGFKNKALTEAENLDGGQSIGYSLYGLVYPYILP